MNTFTIIKDSCNHETLLEARKLEKLEIQIAKSRTARIFNLRCLANKLTLKILQIKWKGNKFEQAIIKKAECSLIHNTIKCTNIKISHLQTEIANTKTSLQQKLDEPTFTDLLNITFNNKEKTFLQYKNTQIKKLELLISRSSTTTSKIGSKTTAITSPTYSIIQDKWVIKLSMKELTPEEKSLLQKGPIIAVTPATIPTKEYISTTTRAAIQDGELNGVDCGGLYHDVNRILNTFTNKPIHTDITRSEHLALENLRKDKDCIIVTADKGIALIVMDKTVYITKCEALLQDNSVYQHLSKDTSPTIHKELVKILQDYKNSNFISETEYTQLRPHGSNSIAARFYGLPKIDKNNIPMWPVVSACSTAIYNTAKFITKILQNYCGKTSSFVKDSAYFIQKIKHLSINPEEETLVSFDVSALTSIPVPLAVQVINSKISTYKNFTNIYKIPTEKCIKLFGIHFNQLHLLLQYEIL